MTTLVPRWRATLHALLGVPLAVGGTVLLLGMVTAWVAAFLSLLGGPTGGWALVALYALVTVGTPVPLLWCVWGLGAAHRTRFHAVLGVVIPAPAPRPGVLRAWRSSATWRQLGYHLLCPVLVVGGGVLVAGCWSAVVPATAYAADLFDRGRIASGFAAAVSGPLLLLAAPWVARGVARADEVAARALLGPSRAEELALRVESLARSRAEVVAATDAERRRIERDLHDGAQQRLVSLAMNLGMARAALGDPTDPTSRAPAPEATAREAIAQAHDEATLALAELRELVRGLHPAILDDRGLDAALSGIAARAPVPVRLRVEVTPGCPPSVEAIAYFVVSEALTNVAKHANAGAAEVTVRRAGDRLSVEVRDDGRGGASVDGGGSGLRGLAQRVAAVDGTLSVQSPPGGPTTITAVLPCGS